VASSATGTSFQSVSAKALRTWFQSRKTTARPPRSSRMMKAVAQRWRARFGCVSIVFPPHQSVVRTRARAVRARASGPPW
jgi:hypothetical protein